MLYLKPLKKSDILILQQETEKALKNKDKKKFLNIGVKKKLTNRNL